MPLHLALVGGPMYDGLYRLLDGLDVEVVAHVDHPTLNRTVAALLERGERIDVLSTHSKYAPSQARWLRPLDTLIEPDIIDELAPRALSLCQFEERLLSVPRNIDVRVLWANQRLLAGRAAPTTWDELIHCGLPFGFPGRESGLFGTFFEIVTVAGGRLFDDDLRPALVSPEARLAVETLVHLARRGPDDLPTWHYDEVDRALGTGRVALAAAWPGATAALRASPAGRHLAPHPYFAGAKGICSYAGCHSWAIPTTCGDLDGAVRLIERLSTGEANALEAESGAVCAHVEAFASLRPADEIDALRLAITRRTIAEAMITYPPLVGFPEVEDAGWSALHRALRGEVDVDRALAEMQDGAERVLGG